MQRRLLGRTSILATIFALALSCGVASASPSQSSAAEGNRASRQAETSVTFLRGGSQKARRAAQRRKTRAAKQRQRAQRRRLLRRQRQRSRRRGIGNQVALTGRRAADNPEILFRGDFESGFDGWHVQSISSRANLFSGGTFQGNGAARFEVQTGDVEPETGSPRSEVSGPTFDEGQDLYFRDAIRIPSASSYEGPWQIVQQLHEEDWGGSPGIAVFLDSDNTMRIGRGDGDATYWESARLQRDRWYDLVYRVYLSRDANAGFVEVWLDGVQQQLDNGSTRAYGETIQTAQTYLKAGIYRSRSSSGTSLVEHDAILVGTSLAAVTAG
jgi:hypothetical protein